MSSEQHTSYGQAPQYAPPQYAPPVYGPPAPYGYGPPPRGTNTMAVLSLVFAFVFWPLGIVFGHVARSQIRRTGEGGSGLALAGLIVSYVALAFVVLIIVLFVAALGLSGSAGGTAPAGAGGATVYGYLTTSLLRPA